MRRVILVFLLLLNIHPMQAKGAEELIELKVAGDLLHKSLLFHGGSNRAAVLVHQSGETMESWREFAQKLADRGVSSVALSSMTPDDVLAAVHYLEAREYDDIVLIGASIGGAAITQALAAHDFDTVSSVVLLGPSSGPAMTSGGIEKMIIVAKADFYNSRAYRTFDEAADPKILKEYVGTEHGQALLKGVHAQNILQEILTFLRLSP